MILKRSIKISQKQSFGEILLNVLLFQKETLAQVLFYEFCKICQSFLFVNELDWKLFTFKYNSKAKFCQPELNVVKSI